MQNRIELLYEAIVAREGRGTRTARLMAKGRERMGKKLGEEAVEAVIAFIEGDRNALVHESADLLYHLTVLWAELGVSPAAIWSEMDRRSKLLGLAEKLPKVLAMRRGYCARRRTMRRGLGGVP